MQDGVEGGQEKSAGGSDGVCCWAAIKGMKMEVVCRCWIDSLRPRRLITATMTYSCSFPCR